MYYNYNSLVSNVTKDVMPSTPVDVEVVSLFTKSISSLPTGDSELSWPGVTRPTSVLEALEDVRQMNVSFEN